MRTAPSTPSGQLSMLTHRRQRRRHITGTRLARKSGARPQCTRGGGQSRSNVLRAALRTAPRTSEALSPAVVAAQTQRPRRRGVPAAAAAQCPGGSRSGCCKHSRARSVGGVKESDKHGFRHREGLFEPLGAVCFSLASGLLGGSPLNEAPPCHQVLWCYAACSTSARGAGRFCWPIDGSKPASLHIPFFSAVWTPGSSTLARAPRPDRPPAEATSRRTATRFAQRPSSSFTAASLSGARASCPSPVASALFRGRLFTPPSRAVRSARFPALGGGEKLHGYSAAEFIFGG